MPEEINVNFRPKTYFRPQTLDVYLISQVKSAVVRDKLERLLAEGRHEELQKILGKAGVPKLALKALESTHPMFMGGNYLPETEDAEVEIARIELASTTFDVTALLAKFANGQIHFSVVDEYEGATLTGPSEMKSEKPLTLGEMADFFLSAWSLIEALEMNFEADLDGALGFFVAKSDFYPDFDRLCRKRIIEAFPAPEPEEPEEEDG